MSEGVPPLYLPALSSLPTCSLHPTDWLLHSWRSALQEGEEEEEEEEEERKEEEEGREGGGFLWG